MHYIITELRVNLRTVKQTKFTYLETKVMWPPRNRSAATSKIKGQPSIPPVTEMVPMRAQTTASSSKKKEEQRPSKKWAVKLELSPKCEA